MVLLMGLEDKDIEDDITAVLIFLILFESCMLELRIRVSKTASRSSVLYHPTSGCIIHTMTIVC